MAAEHTIRRIENHTSRLIVLPSTLSFPNGIRLIPGLNTVPVMYLEELEAYSTPAREVLVGGRKVQRKERFPGREVLEDLQKPVTRPNSERSFHIAAHNGLARYSGPQITIYPDAMEDRPDGPPPPEFLPTKKEQALPIIAVTTDRAALKRWSQQGRGEVAQAAAAKLASLANG